LRKLFFGETMKKEGANTIRLFLIIFVAVVQFVATAHAAEQDGNNNCNVRGIDTLNSVSLGEWSDVLGQLDLLLSNRSLKKDIICDEVWKIIWPWLRAGRAEGAASVMGLAYEIGLNLPGRGSDYITRLRDYSVLSVYGFQYDNIGSRALLKNYIEGLDYSHEFFSCVSEGGVDCASIFARKGIVPDFEDFIREIEVFLNAGYGPICLGAPNSEDSGI
jgi:hypothetical protein